MLQLHRLWQLLGRHRRCGGRRGPSRVGRCVHLRRGRLESCHRRRPWGRGRCRGLIPCCLQRDSTAKDLGPMCVVSCVITCFSKLCIVNKSPDCFIVYTCGLGNYELSRLQRHSGLGSTQISLSPGGTGIQTNLWTGTS